MNEERERLALELKEKGFDDCWAIADYILADRTRIVAPLVKYKRNELEFTTSYDAMIEDSIDETLKLSGVKT